MSNGIDTLSKYGQSFQSKVVSALLVDDKLLDTLSEIMKPDFFESEPNQWIVDTIMDYHDEYKKPPSMDVFKVEVSKLDDKTLKKTIVDQLRHVYSQVGNVDFEYIKKEFTDFCRNQNLKRVIMESVDLLKIGEYDQIQQKVEDAMKAGVNSELGHDYKEDFDKRMNIDQRTTVPTGWKVMDDIMDGGLGPGELGVVVAPSGAGKSWCLSAIGAKAIEQGYSVVHYTLELNEEYVGKRYDTILTEIPSTELDEREADVLKKVESIDGRLLIKYFPPKGVTYRRIEQHLEKMIAAGNKPDLIIIDYADLLLSHTQSADSTYREQGGIYVELRGMGGEYEIPIWTASQASRGAINEEVIEADKIADSYAKVMHADFIISLSRMSNDKISNTARFHIMKNRFGVDGITFPSKMNTNLGKIDIYDGNSPDGVIVNKETQNGKSQEKQLLHKKYKDLMGDSKPAKASLG